MFNAIVSLYHFHETIWHYSPHLAEKFKDVSSFRDHIRSTCKHFDHAEAICVYFKHAKPSNQKIKQLINSIVDVAHRRVYTHSNVPPDERDPKVVFAIDFTKPYEADEEIFMQLADGTSIIAADIATSLNEMWGEILCEIEEKVALNRSEGDENIP